MKINFVSFCAQRGIWLRPKRLIFRSLIALILIHLLGQATFLCPQFAWAAQPNESAVRYEDVLAQAMINSSIVREIDSGFASNLGDAVGIELLPNPELEADIGIPFSYSEGNRGVEPVSLSIAQPVRLSYFGLRKTVGDLIRNNAEQEKQAGLIEFNQSIRLNYVKVWTLQLRESALINAQKRVSRIAAELKRTVTAGGMALGEATVFSAEMYKLEAELAGVKAELSKARAELVRISGVSLEERKLAEPPLFTPRAGNELLDAAKQQGLPLQKRALLKEQLAREYAELAEKDAYPSFAPRLFYQRSEEDTNYIGVGFSVELPLFDRNQPEKLRREADLAAASAKAGYLGSASFQMQLKLLLDSYQATRAQINIYQDKVVPALEQALGSFENQFRAGQGMVLQIWQTETELIDAQARITELLIQNHEQLAEISALLGEAI